LKLTNVTQKDALACAFASRKTPQKFNLKFNQKSTTRGSEENHFSYFSDVEEEGPIELGDYFSDDEEDDTWDKEDLTSENFHEWNPVISGLETIHEPKFEDDGEAKQLNHISGLSEETRLSLSTWHPFIPLEHAFQNYAVQSPPSDFLSQASFLQEHTLTRISTISTSTRRTSSPMEPTSPRLKIPLSRKLRQTEFPDPSRPPSQRLRTRPCKPFYSPTYSETPTPRRPSFTNSSTKSALPNHKLPDHPGQSKQYKLWKQQSQGSTKTSQIQNTRFQNTPQATDAGGEHQVYTQLKSPSYSTMRSKRNTTEIKSWETEWPKFSNKTQTYQTKSQKNSKPPRRNSRRIQLWPWSQEQYPPTCSLNTAKMVKRNQNKKICPHGEIHSSTSKAIQLTTNISPEWPDHQNQATQPWRKRLLSGSYENWRHHHSRFKQFARWKRRSTFLQTRSRKISKLKSKITPTSKELSPKRRSGSASYNRYKRFKSKNNLKSEHEDIKMQNKRKLKTLLETAKAKVTA
jgi:hypothetical protein